MEEESPYEDTYEEHLRPLIQELHQARARFTVEAHRLIRLPLDMADPSHTFLDSAELSKLHSPLERARTNVQRKENDLQQYFNFADLPLQLPPEEEETDLTPSLQALLETDLVAETLGDAFMNTYVVRILARHTAKKKKEPNRPLYMEEEEYHRPEYDPNLSLEQNNAMLNRDDYESPAYDYESPAYDYESPTSDIENKSNDLTDAAKKANQANEQRKKKGDRLPQHVATKYGTDRESPELSQHLPTPQVLSFHQIEPEPVPPRFSREEWDVFLDFVYARTNGDNQESPEYEQALSEYAANNPEYVAMVECQRRSDVQRAADLDWIANAKLTEFNNYIELHTNGRWEKSPRYQQVLDEYACGCPAQKVLVRKQRGYDARRAAAQSEQGDDESESESEYTKNEKEKEKKKKTWIGNVSKGKLAVSQKEIPEEQRKPLSPKTKMAKRRAVLKGIDVKQPRWQEQAQAQKLEESEAKKQARVGKKATLNKDYRDKRKSNRQQQQEERDEQ